MRGIRSADKLRIEKVLDTLTELVDYSSRGVPILVEGRKDEDALKGLGVTGRIIRVSQPGKRLFEIAEELRSCETVVILTDFDQEGEKLAKELSRHLHSWGVQTILRNKVRNAVTWASRQIEGLTKIEGLREHLNNKQFIINSA
ncbi:MAG: toprim domain-containing protein [Promethearchaeati archaeon SRVP18_Atabeyarchaeia-1]